ncbi:MAG: hypothetical protein KBE91_09160 [Bacteroidia bacterium]|nr:hypothetical protein [Bacteroidia bacterium]MBP9689765.1 hypothetical protein [Bacteroidia bacterium]
MNKKTLSIFLFLLFCIVIAFPGYGKNVAVNNPDKHAQIKSTPPASFSLILLIKKCLSNGISVVEEERVVEETHPEDDDGNTNGSAEDEVFYLFHFNLATNLVEFNQVLKNKQIDLLNFAFQFVPKPPPEEHQL